MNEFDGKSFNLYRLPDEVERDKKSAYAADVPQRDITSVPSVIFAQPEQNVDLFILSPGGEARESRLDADVVEMILVTRVVVLIGNSKTIKDFEWFNHKEVQRNPS